MLTALLTRADVSRHLQALHLLAELREAFTRRRFAAGAHQLTFPNDGEGRVLGGAAARTTVVRGAALAGVPAWSVLTHTPGRAVLQLHEAEHGKLLAVMDASQVVSLRAALVGALATDVLARADAKDVAVLGSGPAASSALKALRLVRSLERVWLHEPNEADNFALARRLGLTMAMDITAARSVREAVREADVVVLTGGVDLGEAPLRPGAHVTILSAELFPHAPVPPATLARMRRFTDATGNALAWGAAVEAELGEVLSGAVPGRQGPEDLTLFASVSPAQLDLLAAWHVFEGARHDESLTRIDLEA